MSQFILLYSLLERKAETLTFIGRHWYIIGETRKQYSTREYFA